MKVEIKTNGIRSSIWLDGVEQKWLTDVEWSHSVNDTAKLKLTGIVTEVVIEGDVEVERKTFCPLCKEQIEQFRKTHCAVSALTAAADKARSLMCHAETDELFSK